MKYLFLCLFAIFLCAPSAVFAENGEFEVNSQLTDLQNYRSIPKLYAQNFVLIGEDAIFKVHAKPNKKVKLVLNYGSAIDSQIFEQTTNDQGVTSFTVPIYNNEDLVGKSVEVEAFVYNSANNIQKAVLQNESGSASSFNRIYIADKNSAKGFLFTPWQTLNKLILNYSYDERSGYNPLNDQIYDENTPIYVKNMRNAQDNVREIPTNSNYSNR